MVHGIPAAVRLTIVEAIGPFVIIEMGKAEWAPTRFYVENRDVTPATRLTPGLVTFEEARNAVASELERLAQGPERMSSMGSYTVNEAHEDGRHINGNFHDKTYWASVGCTECSPGCTCGAREYRGCFCNLTIPQFMKSKHAKGI